MNSNLTTKGSNGAPLLRCYWDQGALRQAEWNVPVCGKYLIIILDSIISDEEKEGVILMDWHTWNEHAPWLASKIAFGVLQPMTKEGAFQKAFSLNVQDVELTADAAVALADPRVTDVSYTYFDWIQKAGATQEYILIQMGSETVSQQSMQGLPQAPPITFTGNEAIKVWLELSLEEYTAAGLAHIFFS